MHLFRQTHAQPSQKIAKALSNKIYETVGDREIQLMHVCGTHEAAIVKHGVRALLPENLNVIMGPGCPVCITPKSEIDAAMALAREGVTITTFGDLLRVPGSKGSLASTGKAKIVQSVSQAVEVAERDETVFMAVGFETTAPTTASAILQHPPDNFSILCSHRLIPPAMKWLLEQGEAKLDGFLLPGHVSTIIGVKPYEAFPVPQVIAGFDPLDILYGLHMLVKQVVEGRAIVENAYPRAVRYEGNVRALKLMNDAFNQVDAVWRGFPAIPKSGLALKDKFQQYDAVKKYGIKPKEGKPAKGCRCDELLRGLATPTDCPLFGRKCLPTNPIGPCMVSREGMCKIWFDAGVR